MMVYFLSLILGLSFIYVECLYIAEGGKMAPINVQVYKGQENFEPARLMRQNVEYTKSAGVQPDQTVIVVPNQGVGSVSRQPYGYGTYGNSASRGPTVVVNIPEEYHRVVTDPYRRY